MKELILQKLNTISESIIVEVTEFRNDLSITVQPEYLVDACKLLRDDAQLKFEMCEDVTAIDWSTRKNRFTVVYHIYSFINKTRLRIKVNLEGDEIESVTSVWRSANWYERETFDMYGIKFKNHPDLRRVYMPEEFEYYPLRKEFPVLGIPGSLPLPKGDER
ncbi:MAG: NADH-quinone oxidoreductase subunit C [bacterium]